MNLGRTVFSQLIEHLPSKEFHKCVLRYRGDSYLKSFSCWDQFLSMAFAQLTYRESLRDIETCLRSMHGKLRGRHFGKDILAVFRGLVGGEVHEYTKLLAESREQAIDRMCAEAQSLGANAVIQTQFATSYVAQNMAEILAYGTAVVVEDTD